MNKAGDIQYILVFYSCIDKRPDIIFFNLEPLCCPKQFEIGLKTANITSEGHAEFK